MLCTWHSVTASCCCPHATQLPLEQNQPTHIPPRSQPLLHRQHTVQPSLCTPIHPSTLLMPTLITCSGCRGRRAPLHAHSNCLNQHHGSRLPQMLHPASTGVTAPLLIMRPCMLCQQPLRPCSCACHSVHLPCPLRPATTAKLALPGCPEPAHTQTALHNCRDSTAPNLPMPIAILRRRHRRRHRLARLRYKPLTGPS